MPSWWRATTVSPRVSSSGRSTGSVHGRASRTCTLSCSCLRSTCRTGFPEGCPALTETDGFGRRCMAASGSDGASACLPFIWLSSAACEARTVAKRRESLSRGLRWRRTVNVSTGFSSNACTPRPTKCSVQRKAASAVERPARRGRERWRAEALVDAAASVADGVRALSSAELPSAVGAHDLGRRVHGRRLKGRVQYDLNVPAVPGVPCLTPASATSSVEQATSPAG